jgi:hypothetical protein
MPANDQLAVSVQRYPRPHITVAELPSLLLRDVLFFGVGESPNLITLHAAAIEIAECGLQIRSTNLTDLSKKPKDCTLGRTRHTACRSNRIALDEGGDYAGSFLVVKPVHTVSMLDRSSIVKGFLLGESPFPGQAAQPL